MCSDERRGKQTVEKFEGKGKVHIQSVVNRNELKRADGSVGSVGHAKAGKGKARARWL